MLFKAGDKVRITYRGMNRCARIRKLLTEGAETASGIAVSLRVTKRTARVGLWLLKKQGHVRHAGRIPRTEPIRRGRRWLLLYELTPRGSAAVRIDRKRGADGEFRDLIEGDRVNLEALWRG